MTRNRILLIGAIAVVALIVLFARRRSPDRLLASEPSARTPPLAPPSSDRTGPLRAPALAPDHVRFKPPARPAASAVHGEAPAPATPSTTASRAVAPDSGLLRAADEALEREDYPAALQAAQACLASDPSNRDCFKAELMVYGRTGDFANERVLVEECLFDDPDDVECLEGAVVVEARRKELVAARLHADRLRELQPDGVSSFIADGTVADYSGDRGAAIAAYERACRMGQEFCCFRAEALRNGKALYGP